jgi:hypothetical protein
MVHISEIHSQLSKLGVKLSHWYKPELHELQQILMDDEKIVAASAGRYFNGFALLVATEQRLLLIDKRAFFMIVEDIRYDMVSEIDFSSRIYDFTVYIHTLNKQHNFTTIKFKRQLRDLASYAQQRVWQVRQIQDQASPAVAAVGAIQPSANPPEIQSNSPPLANTSISTGPHLPESLHNISESLHMPHIPRPQKPHVPRQIGLAAMNGSRRFTPNAYTNHLTRHRPFISNLPEVQEL